MPQITYSRKRTHLSAFAPQDAPDQHQRAPPPKAATRDQKITTLFAPKPASQTTTVAPKRVKMTQMTIDVGANPRKTCKECGMEYIPSNPEDSKLHLKYHAKILSGIQVGASVLTSANKSFKRPRRRMLMRQNGAKPARVETEDLVLEITRRDNAQVKTLAARVLGIAEEELGAVCTDGETLWGQVADRSGQLHDRHKVYVYVHDGYCVGLCLARRIRFARAVVDAGAAKAQDGALPTPPPSSPSEEVVEKKEELALHSSSVSVAPETVPAFMGVSRIWVSREARGLGVAEDLLDVALKNFALGRALKKDETAFSQPTNSGLRLARKWYGKVHGWLLYDEQNGVAGG